MHSKHLAQGSTKPEKVNDKLRLYSMEFCPFALRSRLVLLVKQVPHDIVNIHLKKKPDWYLEINPKGMVPAIDTGTEIITESLDVCDYLDEKYPEPPLYPTDEKERLFDKELIKQFNELTNLFSKTYSDSEKKPLTAYLNDLKPHVQKYEDELRKRGGIYFGGDKPCMVDYMIWPWAPRALVLKLIYNQDIPSEVDFPCLYTWCRAMHSLKPVQETYTELDRLYKLSKQYAEGPQAVDYDAI